MNRVPIRRIEWCWKRCSMRLPAVYFPSKLSRKAAMADTTACQHEPNPLEKVRKRLGDLNTKAYYLLVALSFLCFHGSAPGSGISLPLKWALTLTGLAAVLPLQDLLETNICWLSFARWFKVSLLTIALGCTLWWIWRVLA